MSFSVYDDDQGIETQYWVFLEGVSLDFDAAWTWSEVEICRKGKFREWSRVVKGCRRWVGPRSLVWVPSTRCHIGIPSDIAVQYGEGYHELPHTSVIAGWEDVAALAEGAEYQHGSARLEIKRDFRFGASTVRLIVRKISEYCRAQMFNLSVVIEDIHRDEWNKLLEYQQELIGHLDSIAEDVPYPFRGNECLIEQSPSQSNPNDITNDVRHTALESLPLVFKYFND
ncbi:hypothetical protein AB1N83_013211 [Pleurotus pulmonarius]